MIDKIRWKINRLSLMSPLEIGYRFREEIKKKVERKSIDSIIVKTPSPEKNRLKWYLPMEDRKALASIAAQQFLWNEEKAKLLLEHKFSFFSFNNKYLDEVINWHCDYKNGKEAPLEYCQGIDYRNFDKVGDIKYIWELNRHQHLVSLAKAYYITGNQKYKDEVKKQILSWIEENPYKKGVNWASSLELGIRLISWSWVWLFLGDIDEGFKQKWLESVYKHCLFISRNFSRYSSANNHLIGEASGLFIACIVWPFEKQSALWREKSFNILVEQIEKQNYEDGVNKEQAFAYQQFVLDFLILAGLLGEKNGVKFPDAYWCRIEQMFVFIASVMDKNGNVPNIGDADDGYAAVLSDKDDFNPYCSLLATGAVLFERGDFKSKVNKFDEKSFWLLGSDGLEKFNALGKKTFVPVKEFKEGGYYILSAFENTDNEIKSVFDCGPLGYLSIAAHGHADALSFTLSVGGEEFLIDTGTYAYHTQGQWRSYFKGTSAHNTIRIDRQDQSVSGGNFMWLKKAKVALEKWESTEKYDHIIAAHNGYAWLKDPVRHAREIYFNKEEKTFIVKDKIRTGKKHFIEQLFHFSPECMFDNTGMGEWEVTNNGYCARLALDKKFSSKLVVGGENPILGWESKRFDVKSKTGTLVNSCECSGNYDFTTVISVIKL